MASGEDLKGENGTLEDCRQGIPAKMSKFKKKYKWEGRIEAQRRTELLKAATTQKERSEIFEKMCFDAIAGNIRMFGIEQWTARH